MALWHATVGQTLARLNKDASNPIFKKTSAPRSTCLPVSQQLGRLTADEPRVSRCETRFGSTLRRTGGSFTLPPARMVEAVGFLAPRPAPRGARARDPAGSRGAA
jgi:hypothetical protein